MNETMAGDAFTEYRLSGVRRFVQTALVIDNEAELSRPVRLPPRTPKRPARRRTASVLRTGEEPSQTTTSNNSEFSALPSDPEREATGHELNAKALTDAFSNKEIICGLYRPEPGEEMVLLATNAARHADVVVIDWLLEGSSSARAKEIIVEILKEDRKGNGRLRLIAVYTSQPGIGEIAKDIFSQVDETGDLKGSFSLGGAVITGDDVRICVLSKPQTIGKAGVEKVPEAELPDRLLKEFSTLSQGLMTSFALHSIAAVRRAAHHVVAVFKEELDGAFLAHRSSIKDPEEATELIIDLLVGELQNAIVVDERDQGQLGDSVLDGWVDARSNTQKFVRGDALASVEFVKAMVKGGFPVLETSKGKLKKVNDLPSEARLDGSNVWEIFYLDKETAWNRQLEFARLSSFKREAYGRTQLPEGWLPTLTLGSVLKILGPLSDADKPRYEGLTSKYYVCMQPRCDSVRLTEETGFPFQTGQAATKNFNLVVRDRDTLSGTPILVNSKPGNTVVLRFAPDEKSLTVRATREAEDYVFEDANGCRFAWIGDIRDLKAQQDAAALAASVQRVGLNEHEWLRLAGEKKIKLLLLPDGNAPAGP